MEILVLALPSAWQIGLVANSLIAAACLAAAWTAMAGRRQSDPLRGLAPAALFLLLGGVHWFHAMVLAVPSSFPSGDAGRAFFADWRVYAAEALAAIAALAYLALRFHAHGEQRVGHVHSEGSRQRGQVLQLQDNVVQDLAAAKLAIELGRNEEAMRLIGQSLAHAKRITTGLASDGVPEARRGPDRSPGAEST